MFLNLNKIKTKNLNNFKYKIYLYKKTNSKWYF